MYISLDVTETKSCSHPYIIDRLTGDNNVTVPVNLVNEYVTVIW